MPHVDGRDFLALFYVAASNHRPAQLVVVVGPATAPTLLAQPPDYVGLTGQVALFSAKAWHILDVRRGSQAGNLVIGTDAADRSAPAVNISSQQRQLRWLNFVWAGVSILLVTGLMIWLWRRPARNKVDATFEVHK